MSPKREDKVLASQDSSVGTEQIAPPFAALLTGLSRPESYAHRPPRVEMVQTHISVVFLAGNLVYKLKKPVRFSFLDYSTLPLRRHYCQEEVRLNRRLAPTVYLGVVPVVPLAHHYKVQEEQGAEDANAVEFMVKMRRLPTEQRLDTLLSEGRVAKEGIHALARRLVRFHATVPADRKGTYGAPELIWQAHMDNFQETAAFVGQTLSESQYTSIRDFSRNFFTEHYELFRQRVRAGRIREGHGDLRCDHVYFLAEGITIIDCIEFSPRLRTCDVASELAFLAMDLELHSAPALAAELVHTYAVQANDEDLLQLLPFYQCYRAYVRGKVESLKSSEAEVSPQEREQARTQARRAFRLAYRYARGKLRPALLVVCGRVGTGKSTLARLLSEWTGFSVLSSDVVRKRLAGLLPTARATSAYGAGLYSESATERTYATLRSQAEEELASGRGVIVDATCRRREARRSLCELGARLGIPVLFLECRASAPEVERRLQERERKGDTVSDATWTIALQEQGDFPAFDDLPDRCHQVVDTEGDPEQVLDNALAAVEAILSSH